MKFGVIDIEKQNNEDILPEIVEARHEISDLVLELNTGDSGLASTTTSNIKGKLDAFIIETEKPVMLEIYLRGMLIFKGHINQNKYMPLRLSPVDSKNQVYAQELDVCYYLNDSLKINVEGEKNTDIKLTVRTC